jgi:hypothetical protein
MSFKNFFFSQQNDENIMDKIQLYEGKWWGKMDTEKTTILEYTTEDGKKRKFKICRMNDDENGPKYVVEARKGIRYGLYPSSGNSFHVVRMKTKKLAKSKGIFKELDGKLYFEVLTKPGLPDCTPTETSEQTI